MTSGIDRGDVNLSIRGVGRTVLGASPGVAVHIDGVYQPRSTMANLVQMDVERVEAVRGPQGTLYGRNANGGAVNYFREFANKADSQSAYAILDAYVQ